MENWEDDTDALLMQLPATGCVFRKLWSDENGRPHSATVSALNLVVPIKSRNLATALRITEEIEDVYPHEITERSARDITARSTSAHEEEGRQAEDKDGARLLLEQHCLWDFDEDGLGRAVHRHGRPSDALVLGSSPTSAPTISSGRKRPKARPDPHPAPPVLCEIRHVPASRGQVLRHRARPSAQAPGRWRRHDAQPADRRGHRTDRRRRVHRLGSEAAGARRPAASSALRRANTRPSMSPGTR
jgi:hypothetical protein